MADSQPGDSDLLTVAKGGGAVFAGRLFVWVARLAIAVIMARILGAEEYGLYTLAFTVATLASALAVLGLDSAIVRYAAVYASRRDPRGLHGTLQVGVGLPAIAGVAISIGLFVLAEPLAHSVIQQEKFLRVAWVVALLVPLMVVNSQLAATLQGLKRIHLAVLAEQFVQPFSRFLLIVVIAVIGLTAERALVASLLATLVATIVLLALARRSLESGLPIHDADRAPGAMLRFSLPVYFSNVVNSVGSNLQTLMLSGLSSLAAVGVFGVANQLNMIGSMFHSSVVSSSMPLFAELHDRADRAGINRLYQTTSKWTVALNLPFFLVTIFFAEGLLAAFGSEFQAGAPALVILALANLANAGTGTSGAVLDMAGYTALKLVNSSLAVGLAVALNLLLIEPLGIVGAAVAVLGSTATVNLLRLVEVMYFVRATPYNRSFAKPIAAAAAGAAAGLAASLLVGPGGPILDLVVGGPILVVVYVTTLKLLGISEEDQAVLRHVRARLTRRSRRGRSEARATEVGREL